VGVEGRHRQSGEADTDAVDFRAPSCPQPLASMFACMRAIIAGAFVAGEQCGEVLHHPRVGIELCEVVEIFCAP